MFMWFLLVTWKAFAALKPSISFPVSFKVMIENIWK